MHTHTRAHAEGSTIYKIAKKFERMFDNRFDKAVLRQGHQKRREAELDGSDLPRKKNNKDKKKTPKKPLTEAQQKHRQEVTKTATTFRELFVQLQSDEMGEGEVNVIHVYVCA